MAAIDLIPLLAPAYVDDPRLQAAIDLVTPQVNPNHCYLDQVIALLAAHTLSLADRGAEFAGVSGAIQSMSEGGLSISFGSSSSAAGSLDGTTYGSEVNRLNRLCYGMVARTAWVPW